MQKLKFDSTVILMKEINGKLLVKCACPIYEIKTNKNGKMYKKCLTNKFLYKDMKDLVTMMQNEKTKTD